MGKVVQTLDGGAPANAGDIAGLAFDVLKALSLKIRAGSTSDWRQYWNVDRYNRPTQPKPEQACRDALLSDLHERLEWLGIDAHRESVYANDKRSGIRVSFAGFNVPVEIKRSCHPTSGRRSEFSWSPGTPGILGPQGTQSTSCYGSATQRPAAPPSAGVGLLRRQRMSGTVSNNR